MCPLFLYAVSCVWTGDAPHRVTPVVEPPRNRRLVAARLLEADEDFAYQGEYLGEVRAVDGTIVPFGLQVVALGDARFSALGFQGGLPGNGWDLETTISWTGAREGSLLVFNGPRGLIMIQRGTGRIIDSAGVEVGHVAKVRRISTRLGAAPPANAVVLFDGSDTAQFDGGKMTAERWLAAGAITKTRVNDFQLHIEFRTPYMPYARGQARGNSGVYIQQRYEVQILDSFGLPPVFNGCGALYRQHAPDVNMCFPPLVWQTYDIYFTAASWDDEGNKTSDARITVMHNGVPIHGARTIPDKTGAGNKEGPADGPIRLQYHGNPVRFRNVWIVVREDRPLVAEDLEGISSQQLELEWSPVESTPPCDSCNTSWWKIWKGDG